MFLNNYHYILLSYTLELLYQCLQHYLFGYYLFCLCSFSLFANWAQFLNITFLLVYFTAAPAPAVLLTVILPLRVYMHHYKHIN